METFRNFVIYLPMVFNRLFKLVYPARSIPRLLTWRIKGIDSFSRIIPASVEVLIYIW